MIQFADSFKWFSSISLSVVVHLQFMVRSGGLVRAAVQLLVQFMIQLVRQFSLSSTVISVAVADQ